MDLIIPQPQPQAQQRNQHQRQGQLWVKIFFFCKNASPNNKNMKI